MHIKKGTSVWQSYQKTLSKHSAGETYLTKNYQGGKVWNDFFCEHNNKKLTASVCGPLCPTERKQISWYSFNQDHFILDLHHLLQIPVSLFLLTCCHESNVLYREKKRLHFKFTRANLLLLMTRFGNTSFAFIQTDECSNICSVWRKKKVEETKKMHCILSFARLLN